MRVCDAGMRATHKEALEEALLVGDVEDGVPAVDARVAAGRILNLRRVTHLELNLKHTRRQSLPLTATQHGRLGASLWCRSVKW